MQFAKKSASLLAAAVLLSVPVAAMAKGDVEAGKKKASVCAACHGMNGQAQIKTYPNLAGQNYDYIVYALKAYKNKQRTGGQAAIMQGQAANLSEQDMQDVAAYFSSLKPGG
ncbi:cytochrome c [Marinobacteraceae bacterium S3BR75-40.1]